VECGIIKNINAMPEIENDLSARLSEFNLNDFIFHLAIFPNSNSVIWLIQKGHSQIKNILFGAIQNLQLFKIKTFI